MPTAYFGTLDYTAVAGDNLHTIAHNYNSTVANIRSSTGYQTLT